MEEHKNSAASQAIKRLKLRDGKKSPGELDAIFYDAAAKEFRELAKFAKGTEGQKAVKYRLGRLYYHYAMALEYIGGRNRFLIYSKNFFLECQGKKRSDYITHIKDLLAQTQMPETPLQ